MTTRAERPQGCVAPCRCFGVAGMAIDAQYAGIMITRVIRRLMAERGDGRRPTRCNGMAAIALGGSDKVSRSLAGRPRRRKLTVVALTATQRRDGIVIKR